MATSSEAMAVALRHHQAGSLDEAIACYRRALALEPQNAAALSNLGAALQQQGKLDDAVASYRAALAIEPNLVETLNNLGAAYKAQAKLADAVECYRRALSLRPGYAEAHNNLGAAFQQLGNLQEAVLHYRRALELNPRFPEAHFNLGTAFKAAGEPDQAIEAYRCAIALWPAHVQAHINLGNALKDRGRLEDAISAYRRAAELAPADPIAHNNLAAALQEAGQLDEAIRSYYRAIELRPELAEAHTNLGTALREQGKLDEAVACHRHAVALAPDYAEAHNHLGTALKDQARLDEALASFRRATELRPDFVAAHSNHLFTLWYSPGFDAAAIYNEHRRFHEQHAQPLARFIPPHANARDPNRRLRIGYLSPDFCDHCQALFTTPLFSSHDHEQFEIFCYADVTRPDAVTSRLQSFADVWRNVAGLPPRETARMIGDDQIDILVDLTMHMKRAHPLVLALKPAPVQVCWLAYPGTTGLAAIDYRLTDPHLDPLPSVAGTLRVPPRDKPDAQATDLFDRFYAETSIRLPDTFWCYDPLTSEPPVNALPAAKNGHITFGSLNNFCKLNPGVLELWASVLKAVDRSRLLLLAPDGSSRQWVLECFEQHGVSLERLSFVTRQPRRKYLELYHQLDIGLDTFPYNGHTTSLDAYWMGVPVITLVGQTVVGRAGLSQLTNLKLPELIAHTPEQFVSIAAELAADPPRLAHLRSTLRDRLQHSPLMDAPRFAQSIEASYRTMWQRWCNK